MIAISVQIVELALLIFLIFVLQEETPQGFFEDHGLG